MYYDRSRLLLGRSRCRFSRLWNYPIPCERPTVQLVGWVLARSFCSYASYIDAHFGILPMLDRASVRQCKSSAPCDLRVRSALDSRTSVAGAPSRSSFRIPEDHARPSGASISCVRSIGSNPLSSDFPQILGNWGGKIVWRKRHEVIPLSWDLRQLLSSYHTENRMHQMHVMQALLHIVMQSTISLIDRDFASWHGARNDVHRRSSCWTSPDSRSKLDRSTREDGARFDVNWRSGASTYLCAIWRAVDNATRSEKHLSSCFQLSIRNAVKSFAVSKMESNFPSVTRHLARDRYTPRGLTSLQ